MHETASGFMIDHPSLIEIKKCLDRNISASGNFYVGINMNRWYRCNQNF